MFTDNTVKPTIPSKVGDINKNDLRTFTKLLTEKLCPQRTRFSESS